MENELINADELRIFVDYDVLHTCEFPVPSSGTPTLEDDCGEPAIYKVYWTLENGTNVGKMRVCQEHFDFIMKCEGNQLGTMTLTNPKKVV